MNIKKTIYIIAAMVLGLLLSFLAHAGIEIWNINRLLGRGIMPQASALTHNCYLPSYLQIILLLAGLIGGYLLGRVWWRLVYIKHHRE